ncbi:MAG: hypothetical protein V4547_20115 [Bacteroidota bacterium]
MSAIALLISPENPIGFLLLANPEAIHNAPSKSEVIFTGTPNDASLLSHPLSTFIQQFKNTEYSCTTNKVSDGISINIHLSASVKADFEFDSNGKGYWLITNGENNYKGYCEITT